jgi:hypothetical protein
MALGAIAINVISTDNYRALTYGWNTCHSDIMAPILRFQILKNMFILKVNLACHFSFQHSFFFCAIVQMWEVEILAQPASKLERTLSSSIS